MAEHARKMGVAETRLIAMELQLQLSSESRSVMFHGESMRPFLCEGDRVVVEPVAWEAIRRGDVITYRFDDKLPTRRVVRVRPDGLDLWCDNWPWLRFQTDRDDVLGRAEARRRGDGPWLRRTDPAWKAAARRALTAYRWERIRGLSLRIMRGLARRARRVSRLARRSTG